MQNIIKSSLLILLASCLFTACSHSNEWTVNGKIDGADGEVLLLEASDNGVWYALDSVTLDASGRFKMSHRNMGYPDIYRLRLGNKTVYFPIDSIETVTITCRADAFDTEYTLEGSPSAEQLMAVDRRVMDVVARSGVKAVSTDSLLKRDLAGIILGDQTGIVSYYIISKSIGGVPIFDPTNKSDLRIIGAVANAYDQFRPNDPRTRYLRNLYLGNRKATSEKLRTDTIHAQEVSYFNIDLMDAQGVRHSLKEMVDRGGTVLLNFTLYGVDSSPAFNRHLHNVYQKYHAQGLEVYQVGLDEDEYTWRQGAKNLPWVTVYNPPTSGAINVANYNVTVVPVCFIIKGGEIVERVDDMQQLDAAVARHI